MNIKRAISIGFLTYIISFIIGMIVMFALGIDPTKTAEIPNSILYINIFITIILAAIFTLFYFKGKRVKPSAKEGFLFGLVLIVIGFILDIIIFSISSFVTESQQNILEYYANPLFWAALILFLATTTVVGAVKGKK